MRQIYAFLCIVAAITPIAAIVTASTAGETDPPPDEIIAQGHKIAKTNCVRCHAIASEEKSPHDDAPPFRDIVKRYSPWLLAEAFAEGITTGHQDMPAFKFNPQQITALLSYLESLQETPTNSTPPNKTDE